MRRMIPAVLIVGAVLPMMRAITLSGRMRTLGWPSPVCAASAVSMPVASLMLALFLGTFPAPHVSTRARG